MSPELYRRARRAEAGADRAEDRRRLRLEFFRAVLAEGLDSLKAMHAEGASGQDSVRAHARFVDDLVSTLTRLITEDAGAGGLAATPSVVVVRGVGAITIRCCAICSPLLEKVGFCEGLSLFSLNH